VRQAAVSRNRSPEPTPGQPDDPPADPESVARAICLRLLAQQPRSRAELAAALRQRKVPEEAAAAVLARFGEVGLIDDVAFAEAWVETRHRGRGLGRRVLAQELRRRGVGNAAVQGALEQLDAETEEAAARALVARRITATRGLATPNRARRLVGMLARKGYPQGLAIRVVRAALAAEGAVTGAELDALDMPDDELSDD
jgi:regulatory protein